MNLPSWLNLLLWGPYPWTHTALLYLLHLLRYAQDSRLSSDPRPFILRYADLSPTCLILSHPLFSLCCILSTLSGLV